MSKRLHLIKCSIFKKNQNPTIHVKIIQIKKTTVPPL